MAPRAGLTTARVVTAAIELVDAEGVDQLSLAALAARLNIRTPSLYNHIDGLDALRRLLALQGLRELGAALQMATVGRAGSDALYALAAAYRAFAHRHPGLYTLTLRSYEAGDSELQQAGRRPVETALAVLRGYGLEGMVALHATRYLRSALHGFVSLELAGGFGLPLEIDQSFALLVQAIDAGLRADGWNSLHALNDQ